MFTVTMVYGLILGVQNGIMRKFKIFFYPNNLSNASVLPHLFCRFRCTAFSTSVSWYRTSVMCLVLST